MTEEKIAAIRKLTNDLVARMTEENDAVLVQTALTMTVHFFCEATNWTHEDFINGIIHLKESSENGIIE